MAEPKAKGTRKNADKRPIGQARKSLDGVPAPVRRFYELGQDVNAKIRDGSQSKADVAKAIKGGGGSVSRAMHASLFAERYTDNDLIRLGKMRTKKGDLLCENHLHHLAMVGDKTMRQKLIKNMRTNGWIAVQLEAEIKRRKGGPEHGGGPKLVRPGSIEEGLRQIEKHSRDWLKHYDGLWAKSEAGWLNVRDETEDADAMREQLATIMDRLRLLEEAASDLKARLATELKSRRAKREGQAGRR